jgi:hypothetical protein
MLPAYLMLAAEPPRHRVQQQRCRRATTPPGSASTPGASRLSETASTPNASAIEGPAVDDIRRGLGVPPGAVIGSLFRLFVEKRPLWVRAGDDRQRLRARFAVFGWAPWSGSSCARRAGAGDA